MRHLAATLVLALFGSGPVGAPGDSLIIDTVDARLFLGHSGSLSAPITSSFALWNTIIGAGDAGEPSDSTLIDVVVKGKPGAYDPKWTIDLIVTKLGSSEVIARFVNKPGVLSIEGRFHVAFWLRGTGCVPLHVVAEIRGTKLSSAKDIGFSCGE